MVNLSKIRNQKGLSQAQLHRLSGVSQSYISELEAGLKQPRLHIVKKLASALGVSILELIEDDPPTADPDSAA